MNSCPLEGDVLARVLPELAQSSMFKGLTPEQLAQIAGHGTLCILNDGEVLMEQGTPSDAFFVLLRGCLSIRMASSDGAQVELRTHSPSPRSARSGSCSTSRVRPRQWSRNTPKWYGSTPRSSPQ
ncbi:hypothetical protein LBMAG42_11390 [Deltaproteobacteria bacterium]|nr:hypothetical protein LBMAG42_11390 [Deltaproteobacteria bacterium]